MDFLCFFSVLCLLCLCVRLFIFASWSSAGKRLTSRLSFLVSKYEFVTFPSVSWVRCGTWLYGFLSFSPLLTLCLSCFGVSFKMALWSPAQKGLTSWLSFVMFNCVFVTFLCGILGQVWCLIVLIPDLCPFY